MTKRKFLKWSAVITSIPLIISTNVISFVGLDNYDWGYHTDFWGTSKSYNLYKIRKNTDVIRRIMEEKEKQEKELQRKIDSIRYLFIKSKHTNLNLQQLALLTNNLTTDKWTKKDFVFSIDGLLLNWWQFNHYISKSFVLKNFNAAFKEVFVYVKSTIKDAKNLTGANLKVDDIPDNYFVPVKIDKDVKKFLEGLNNDKK
ncbi:hypothetical protein ACW95P_04235 [Candidatus Mycoplasma pogonae]